MSMPFYLSEIIYENKKTLIIFTCRNPFRKHFIYKKSKFLGNLIMFIFQIVKIHPRFFVIFFEDLFIVCVYFSWILVKNLEEFIYVIFVLFGYFCQCKFNKYVSFSFVLLLYLVCFYIVIFIVFFYQRQYLPLQLFFVLVFRILGLPSLFIK